MADSIVDSVKGPLSIIDTDRKIIYMNDYGLIHGNKTLSEVVGTPYSENSAYPIGSKFCPITALEEGREAEAYYLEDSGHYVKGAANHFLDKNGEKIGYIIVTTDVTDLQCAKEEAERANRAKSDFLSLMSHELRTPMNAVIGISDLIRTDNLDKTQIGYLSDMRRSSKTLLQIINDILDFSKIEAGKLDVIPTDFSLRALYDNLCSMNLFAAGAKNLEFHSRIDADVPDVVYGDEIRVRQVVTNILSNAIKYTRIGFVRFNVEKAGEFAGDFIAFTVEDSGIGIKEEDMPRLFNSFQQFDTKANRDIVGTGLGLSVVKRITELMGGEVRVESEYGKGSRFTIYLPLPVGNPDNIEQVSVDLCVIAQSDTSILVVDDNSPNLTVALGFLATHNINADTAEGGLEAIEKVTAKDYDIVFMDHMMPDVDGIEVTRRIRAMEGDRFQKTPIIALSANAVTGAKEAFIAAGMNDFISKPIIAERLNQVLLKYLPPEKILRLEHERKVGPLASASESVEKAEPVIDRKKGLSHSADSDTLYRQLLRDFVKNQKNAYAQITDGLAAGDIKLSHRLAHTLKSTSRMIGAEKLGEAAFAVEKALENGEDKCTKEQLNAFARELEAVLRELGAGGDETEKTPSGDELGSLDAARALELAERLTPLLKSRRTSASALIDEIKEVFSPLGALSERLSEQIDNFDFNAAMDTLLEIRQKVENIDNAKEEVKQ
jgi:signal transduction histidine kinase/DNA-binding NarL/FixJ family response regulator